MTRLCSPARLAFIPAILLLLITSGAGADAQERGGVAGVGQEDTGSQPKHPTSGVKGTARRGGVKRPVSRRANRSTATRKNTREQPRVNVETYVDQADDLLDAGKYAEAIPIFQKAISLDPNSDEAYYGLGFAYRYLTQLSWPGVCCYEQSKRCDAGVQNPTGIEVGLCCQAL